jgi:hypothetical protein
MTKRIKLAIDRDTAGDLLVKDSYLLKNNVDDDSDDDDDEVLEPQSIHSSQPGLVTLPGDDGELFYYFYAQTKCAEV